MRKNSLEVKKRQHQMLLDQEKRQMEKRERRLAARAVEKPKTQEDGEDTAMSSRKIKFERKVRPRREYKAQRRRERLAKYAPRILSSDNGDVDMADLSKPKNIVPVSKTLRLTKDKSSIRK
jgi:hypothetical protein